MFRVSCVVNSSSLKNKEGKDEAQGKGEESDAGREGIVGGLVTAREHHEDEGCRGAQGTAFGQDHDRTGEEEGAQRAEAEDREDLRRDEGELDLVEDPE